MTTTVTDSVTGDAASTGLPPVVFDGVIDVSHYNGIVDWPAVAAAGIALTFVKATQGSGFVDPAFERNRSGAAAAGLLVVPYHFIDASDADTQAAHFLTATGLAAMAPAMIDWETAATAESVVAFGAAIAAQTGRDPLAYYGFAQLRQAEPTLARWPLMLPAYPRGQTSGDYAALVTRMPRLPPGRAPLWQDGRPYDFHQYTPAGRIPGIATSVDRSVWVGALAELQAWFATAALPAASGAATTG